MCNVQLHAFSNCPTQGAGGMRVSQSLAFHHMLQAYVGAGDAYEHPLPSKLVGSSCMQLEHAKLFI